MTENLSTDKTAFIGPATDSNEIIWLGTEMELFENVKPFKDAGFVLYEGASSLTLTLIAGLPPG